MKSLADISVCGKVPFYPFFHIFLKSSYLNPNNIERQTFKTGYVNLVTGPCVTVKEAQYSDVISPAL